MQPDLHISIVSFNTRDLLDKCLQSIFSRPVVSTFDVTVIDNGSTDGSVNFVREHYPRVRVLLSGGNIGYGRANNAALRGVHARYYGILNSDLILQEGAIDRLIRYLDEHPEVGAAGGALLNPNADTLGLPWDQWESHAPQTNWAVGELTVASVAWEQLFLSKFFSGSRVFGDYFRSYWSRDQDAVVPQVCGAFLLTRAPLFNALGGFDPLIFMYCEDTDLCRRVRDAGFDVVYVAAAQAIHVHGQSSKGALRPRMIYEHNRSRCYYFAKHVGTGAAIAARSLMLIGALLRTWERRSAPLVRPSAATGYAVEASGFATVFWKTLLMRVPKIRIESPIESAPEATQHVDNAINVRNGVH